MNKQNEIDDLLFVGEKNDLEFKWSSIPRPYAASFSEYLKRQSSYESNARSYPRKFSLAISRALGMYVEDTDGRVFMDCLSGAGSLPLGHNHAVVIDAIRDCIDNKRPLHTLDITTPVKDDFVKKLFKFLPETLQKNTRIQFCSPSGADGVEAALKLVKTYTGRGGIFAFEGAYHGMSHGALSITSCKSIKEPIDNLMKDVTFLPYPYHYRCPFGIGGQEAEDISLTYIENILKDSHSGVLLPAAFILEIVQGEGGSIPASHHWIRGIRRITSKYNIPLIVDEVQTGIGRTGTGFAFEAAGIVPDVVVISKAIGGGLPLSLIVYQDYLDAWKPGAHTGTFRGNQMAMATGSAVLGFIKENDLIKNANEVGEYLQDGFRKLQEKFSCIGEVRGRGLMIGVEIIDRSREPNTMGSYPPGAILADTIQRACFTLGLIVETGGREDCVFRFMPPLTITFLQADTVLEIFEQALTQTFENK